MKKFRVIQKLESTLHYVVEAETEEKALEVFESEDFNAEPVHSDEYETDIFIEEEKEKEDEQ